MFHGCGVIDRNRGILFLGRSGQGKSTIGKLWYEDQATIHNDDRVIVRKRGEEMWMYGTPWHGDFEAYSEQGLAIQKIFFIESGKRNSTAPQQGAVALSKLLSLSFPPLWDAKGMGYTIELCHRLVETIPCHRLSFVPDERVLDCVTDL